MSQDSRSNGNIRRRLRGNLAANRPPCWLCGQPIDYSLPIGHPASFTMDHIRPFAARPDLALEPSNVAAAHQLCNQVRGTRAPRPGVGFTSRDW